MAAGIGLDKQPWNASHLNAYSSWTVIMLAGAVCSTVGIWYDWGKFFGYFFWFFWPFFVFNKMRKECATICVPPGDLDVSQLPPVLRELGVKHHADKLAEKQIGVDELRTLTNDELKEIGFKMEERKRVARWQTEQEAKRAQQIAAL